MLQLLPLVPALPLAGFLILLVAGRRLPGRAAAWLATLLVGASFLLSVAVGTALPRASGPALAAGEMAPALPTRAPGEHGDTGKVVLGGVTQHLWTWMSVGEERVAVTVALAPLYTAKPIPAGAVGTMWVPLGEGKDRALWEWVSSGRTWWDPVAVVGQNPVRDLEPGHILTNLDVPPPGGGEYLAAPLQRQVPFTVDWALHLDALSLLMILVVTGVGFLIHVFSVGYMGADADVRRYFMYLNLFVASMLVLVLGGNYLVLFVGWELVGLCSYLLIGFWYKDSANASAGRKAFIVNRVGDFAFLVGLMLMWSTFGSLAFGDVFGAAAGMAVGTPVVVAICLLLLIGATGKSAQLPLYVWLPDAMAGPTPVSALIHAATMVTAGVYMIARSHILYDLAPGVLLAVAVVGAATALLAAIIALAQLDIKRVLAYSTISQLGFMFLALGAGAYVAAVFHLMTHAFFKALLFLGAGSAMHGMEHGFHAAHAHPPPADGIPAHQDMRQMGGLLKRMPITGWTFVVGGLALAGLIPLAGFWSKDAILHGVLTNGSGYLDVWLILFGVAAFTALVTAFYTGRQMFMVFAGAPRSAGAAGATESPPVMTVPLVVLALLTAVAGFLGLELMGGAAAITAFLAPALGGQHGEAWFPAIAVPLLATAVTVAGLALAWLAYGPRPVLSPARAAARFPRAYRFLWNKLYVDELYLLLFVRPFRALAGFFWRVVDDGLVDGAVNGLGRAVAGAAQLSRRWQTGFARQYALSMLAGGLALILYLVLKGL